MSAEQYDEATYDEWYKAAGKDYAAEAKSLLRAVEDAAGSPVASVLDVACGTGRHAAAITHRGIDVTGIDAHEGFIRRASARVPSATFHVASMLDFELNEQFDAVICCFSAIGHVASHAELDQAVERMASHVRPGGALVIEPWFSPSQWLVGHPSVLTVQRDGYAASRVNVSGREGDVALVNFACAEATEAGVRMWEEKHRLLLIEPSRYELALERAGLQTRFAPSTLPRGAWIGTREKD